MSTNPTPTERVQQAQALLYALAGDPKAQDFIPVVTMSDDQMETFVYQLGNLLSLVVKTAEVTARVSKARAEQRAYELSRLEHLAGLAKQ